MAQGIDHTGISIVFFCHDGKGNFVMDLRGANSRDEVGKWEIGGGALEHGQKVEVALYREVKEEYCADIKSFEFIGYRDVHRIHQGKRTHWITLDFSVLVRFGQVKNGEPDKFDEVRWFNMKNLPENVHSQLSVFIKKYKRKLFS